MLKWKLILVCLEIVLILIQDRCTICVERTIGSEMGSDAPNGTPGDMGHVDSCFSPFEDRVSVGAR
jgi:hypothetical protein